MEVRPRRRARAQGTEHGAVGRRRARGDDRGRRRHRHQPAGHRRRCPAPARRLGRLDPDHGAAATSAAIDLLEIGPALLAETSRRARSRVSPARPRVAALLERHQRSAEGRRARRTPTSSLPCARRSAACGSPPRRRRRPAAAAPSRDGLRLSRSAAGSPAGARLVMLPRFDPRTFVADVQVVTVLIVPPPVLGFLVASRSTCRPSSSSSSGGAPLGAPLQRAVAERFPHAVVGQGYGLTETTAGRRDPRPRARHRARLGGASCCPTPSCASVGGELLIRGPQTMTGYLGRLEATAELIDRDGWLHSGDLGLRRRRRQCLRRRPPEGVDQGQRAPGRAGRARGGARAAIPPWPSAPSSAVPTSAAARSRSPSWSRARRSTATR